MQHRLSTLVPSPEDLATAEVRVPGFGTRNDGSVRDDGRAPDRLLPLLLGSAEACERRGWRWIIFRCCRWVSSFRASNLCLAHAQEIQVGDWLVGKGAKRLPEDGMGQPRRMGLAHKQRRFAQGQSFNRLKCRKRNGCRTTDARSAGDDDHPANGVLLADELHPCLEHLRIERFAIVDREVAGDHAWRRHVSSQVEQGSYASGSEQVGAQGVAIVTYKKPGANALHRVIFLQWIGVWRCRRTVYTNPTTPP
jgi:hypothetical protein